MHVSPRFTRLLIIAAALVGSGCGRSVGLVPVRGRVTIDGEPLSTGAVMLQPDAGPASQAKINPDGSFCLGTFEPEDGAIPGRAVVRVICRQDITPAGGERAFGPSLIPEHYTRFETSGLEVDVQPGMDSLDIALTR